MAWLVLVVSGVLEAVWATALSKSDGFTKLVPSIVFVIALLLSMGGLAYAMPTCRSAPAIRYRLASARSSRWSTQ